MKKYDIVTDLFNFLEIETAKQEKFLELSKRVNDIFLTDIDGVEWKISVELFKAK
jgi:hypothetical protein